MSEDNKGTAKKIGLFACICTGIGSIIGSGIFGSLPAEINEIGPAVILAFVLATIYKLAASFPAVYSSSIIPTTGSFFLMPTKLIHPIVGLYMSIQNLLQPVLISVFGVLFADYFCTLFPGMEGKQTLVAVLILVVYGILAYMGNYVFASFNTVIVIIMLIAIAIYIFFGFGNFDASAFTVSEALGSGVKFSSIAAAVSVLASCLSGGNAVSQIADDVKDSRRNVPIALILAPVIVAFIYILMSVVTLGCMKTAEITTLSEVGETFMGHGLLIFFIVGGPLCGVLTSMVPVIMLTCAQIQVAAEQSVFPTRLANKNKHGVATGVLIYTMAFAIVCVLTGASFGVLMTVFSAVNALADIPTCIVPFFLKKKYPHACNHAGINFNYIFICIVSVFAAVVATILAVAAFKSLGAQVYMIIFTFMAIAIIYLIARFAYCKKNGFDLMASLKAPFEDWEKREEECAKLDAMEN